MLLVIVTGTSLLLATILVHGVAVLWLYYIGVRPLSHAERLSRLRASDGATFSWSASSSPISSRS